LIQVLWPWENKGDAHASNSTLWGAAEAAAVKVVVLTDRQAKV
jgi:hypothetical protein